MKVFELIEELEKMDQQAEVYYCDYERGDEDVEWVMSPEKGKVLLS